MTTPNLRMLSYSGVRVEIIYLIFYSLHKVVALID